MWEAKGKGVRRLSVDPLPPSASLTAFRGADGETVLLLSSFSGLRVSRRRRRPVVRSRSRAGRNSRSRCTARLSASPVLVTTTGLYRTTNGRTLRVHPRESRRADERRAPGRRLGRSRSSRSARPTALFAGTVRRGTTAGARCCRAGSSSTRTAANRSPRRSARRSGKSKGTWCGRTAGVASPCAARGPVSRSLRRSRRREGRLYVGTAGDGLFLFEP